MIIAIIDGKKKTNTNSDFVTQKTGFCYTNPDFVTQKTGFRQIYKGPCWGELKGNFRQLVLPLPRHT